jgi:leucyl-tRNA synthetase
MESETLKEALKTWLKLLAPFAPHLCEELWSEMKEEGFISLAEWPKINEKQIDTLAEEKENFIEDLIEDTLNVLKATKITPQKIFYYTASPWKWKVYQKMLEKSKQGEVKLNELMKELSEEKELKENMKEVAKFATKILKEAGMIPENRRENMLKIKKLNEKEIIDGAKEFLSERFKAQITVYNEEDENIYDPKQRATMAIPCRPAIYIE